MPRRFGLDFVYCWHGLPAYWAGVMPGSPELEQHRPTLMFAQPTPGVLEVEPSMAWNPAVLAGVWEGRLVDGGMLGSEWRCWVEGCKGGRTRIHCF
jgi:raffinose synthase